MADAFLNFAGYRICGTIGSMDEDGFTSLGDTLRVHIEADIVFIRNDGVTTLKDMNATLELYWRVYREQGRLFVLYDCSRIAGIEPAARKALMQSHSKAPEINAMAIFGASFAIRTLGNMIDRALVGLGGKATGMKFFQTEAQARAYLQAEQIRIRAKAAR